MSIKNFYKVICIKDLTRGNTEVLHDYFKYSDDIKKELLFSRLNKYLEDNQDFAISYMVDSNYFDLGIRSE